MSGQVFQSHPMPIGNGGQPENRRPEPAREAERLGRIRQRPADVVQVAPHAPDEERDADADRQPARRCSSCLRLAPPWRCHQRQVGASFHERRDALPCRIFQSFTAYQQTAAMRAAIDLNSSPRSAGCDDAGGAGEGDRGVGARPPHALRSAGGRPLPHARRATVTPSRRRPRCSSTGAPARTSAAAITFLTSPTIVEAFARLTDAVRRGGTALDHEGTVAPDASVWVDFARSMKGLAGFTAELVANLLEVDARRSSAGRSSTWPPDTGCSASPSHAGIRGPRWWRSTGGRCWRSPRRTPREAGVADRVRLLPGRRVQDRLREAATTSCCSRTSFTTSTPARASSSCGACAPRSCRAGES